MNRALVAGAGHGGLTAAVLLAKNGWEVTVLESRDENDMGHDWHDMMALDAFDFAGIDRPPQSIYTSGQQMGFLNPAYTEKIVIPFDDENKNSVCIDRKGLIKHLISCAKKAGASIKFGTQVISPVFSSTRVIGLNARDASGRADTYYADIVIDSAGIDSPVRRLLENECGVVKEIEPDETFYVYRAYFNKTADEYTDPRYLVYFYHNYRPGIDWVITEKDYLDVLVGKFSPLSEDEVKEAIADFREHYPYMGDKILRGGTMEKIPIRRTLPMLVCDGYAAIGDSAAMTVPLNGSGITLSIKAGKILVGAILGIKNKGFTREALWQYQYRYYKLLGEQYVIVDKIRKFVTNIKGENVDFFLENKILTSNEISLADGKGGSLTVGGVIMKLIYAIPQAYLLPELAESMRGFASLKSIFDTMPAQYDEKAVNEWTEKYIRA